MPVPDRSDVDHAAEAPNLHEMLRIMDVARTLRREQDIVLQQFNLEQTKARLRERLLASTEITGEQLTEAEVEAAIDLYYDNLHTFRPPRRSLSVFLAHLWVLRRGIILGLFIIGVAILIWFWLV